MSPRLQMYASLLGLVGWMGTILACILPLWRVTTCIDNNVTWQYWEGLWMSCMVQSIGQMQCSDYDSILALSSDFQASRTILVIGPLVGLVAVFASIAGSKYIKSLDKSKAKVVTAAGVLFLIAGILSLVPPSWIANSMIRGSYDPGVAFSQKIKLGPSIFICWGSVVLMIIGGGHLCTSWPFERVRQNYFLL